MFAKFTEYEFGTHVETTFRENVECLQNTLNMSSDPMLRQLLEKTWSVCKDTEDELGPHVETTFRENVEFFEKTLNMS